MRSYIWLIALLSFFLGACQSSDAQVINPSYRLLLKTMYENTVPLMSTKELSRKSDDLVILDTRVKAEYEVSHLKNAKWVGYDTFNKKRLKDIPKDQPIAVYCSIGYRSERIGEQLLEMGYKKVYNLNGGIFEWINQDQKVLDENNTETERVHSYSKSWGTWLDKGEKVY